MASVNRSTLKGYFETGDKPTQANFEDLVDSNINLTDDSTVSGKITLGGGTIPTPNCLSIASGSADVWNVSAPPMVPNLQPHIKVVNLDVHTIMHEAIFGDEDTNTHLWEADDANSGDISAKSNATDFEDGGFILVTGGGSGNQTAVATSIIPFRCDTGLPWWITTRVAFDDHDLIEFFFGITEQKVNVDSPHTSAAANGKDRVGFVKDVHSDDSIHFAASKGTGGTIATDLDTAQTYDADASVLTMGIHWDGAGNIKFYLNKVATGTEPGNMALVHTYTTTAGIPDDSNNRLILFIENGSAAARTATVEYIHGAYTTTVTPNGL